MRMLLIFKSFKSCAMQQNSARILKAFGSLQSVPRETMTIFFEGLEV